MANPWFPGNSASALSPLLRSTGDNHLLVPPIPPDPPDPDPSNPLSLSRFLPLNSPGSKTPKSSRASQRALLSSSAVKVSSSKPSTESTGPVLSQTSAVSGSKSSGSRSQNTVHLDLGNFKPKKAASTTKSKGKKPSVVEKEVSHTSTSNEAVNQVASASQSDRPLTSSETKNGPASHHRPRVMDEWNQPNTVPECLFSSLQRLSWSEYTGEPQERDTVVYILKHALHLKTATIKSSELEVPKFEMLKELSLSSRASAACQLMFE
ncbi:hypothetical protein YC2023_102340 [Brassica napus]